MGTIGTLPTKRGIPKAKKQSAIFQGGNQTDPSYCSYQKQRGKEMSMVPLIEVSHLPSSASFYAAVSQPLGIQFISHTSRSSLDFGLPASPAGPCEILFTLTQSPNPQRSLLKFRASSQIAVTEFHWRALQTISIEIPSTKFIKHTAEESIARITDLDGNMLEARYNRRNSLPLLPISTPPREARRVLEWQRDVARSMTDDCGTSTSTGSAHKNPQAGRSSPSHLKVEDQGPRLLRRETIATSHHQPGEPQAETEDRIVGSMSNQTLIGTILGATAAVAVVAYAMGKSEEPRCVDPARPRLVSYHTSPPPVSARVQKVERTMEAVSFHSVSRAGTGTGKTEEPKQVEKKSAETGKDSLSEAAEEKSVSHRDREREPSEAKIGDRKIADSVVSKSSRHTSKSKKHREQPSEIIVTASTTENSPSEKSGHSKNKSKKKSEAKSQSSYVSARSEASTVKPKEKDKARSRVTTTLTVSNKEAVDRASQRRGSSTGVKDIPLPDSTYTLVSARDIPLPESTYTRVSARHVPLPESMYTASVAPSDSISSAGWKKERLRRRM